MPSLGSTLEIWKFKVDYWTFSDGRSIVEVALHDKSRPVVIDDFRDRVVRRLLAAGAKPMTTSKADLAGKC